MTQLYPSIVMNTLGLRWRTAGIISLCSLLHWLLSLHAINSLVRRLLQAISHFLCSPPNPSPVPKNSNNKLDREEVEVVMEKLGISRNPNGEHLQERVGSDEIEALFENEEVDLEDAREAFEVFDENCDGFIDASELKKVVCSLGFGEISKLECEKMILAFDDNGDGRIDFGEFAKLLENSSW
ncbi:probable calcium-binding protein CML45 [Actinidia eriantha]|uniref:probable calcium-binding protein CML45 n=1 Tax=Actinidia eriantha TaxID=165200 RepID=UPI0025844DC0|nr:probable calcium-binding protein CML45 [Actinidia eriantha]